MRIEISANREEMGESAAGEAAKLIIAAIEKKGVATIVLATGASQFEVLQHLVSHPGIYRSRVTMFHLDEYVGMTEAVKNCLEEPVSNLRPASILREHPDCSLYLDRESASLLSSGKK